MSETVKDLSSFVKQVIARLKGDDEGVLAQKVERKSRAAINQQIGALENKIVDLEDSLAEAQEKLNDAIYPIVNSTSTDWGKDYINAIQTARVTANAKENALEEHKDSLAYFKSLLVTFD